MRRILAIAIVLILGLPAVSPLLALADAADLNLPSCCRRAGKHHCMVMPESNTAVGTMKAEAKFATVSDRCPYGSHSLPGSLHSGSTPGTSAVVYAELRAHPSVAPQTESKRRISADRSRQKRGPPSNTFAPTQA